MNWLDIIIMLVVLLFGWIGWRSGFIYVMLDLIGVALTLVGTLLLYRYAAQLLNQAIPDPNFASAAGFLIVLFLLMIILGILVRIIYSRIPANIKRSHINNGAGVPLGLIKGVVVCAIGVSVLAGLPGGLSGKTITGSYFGRYLLNAGAVAEQYAMKVIPQDVRKGLTFVTIKPTGKQSLKIPKETDISINPTAESEMLKLLNSERTRRGLAPLRIDTELRAVARTHSKDMFVRGYFAHISPSGTDPFDRLRKAGVEFTAAGENLAMAPTVEIAHDGLMNSPGHRANILRPVYRRVGIGVYRSDTGRMMFSQEFAR